MFLTLYDLSQYTKVYFCTVLINKTTDLKRLDGQQIIHQVHLNSFRYNMFSHKLPFSKETFLIVQL